MLVFRFMQKGLRGFVYLPFCVILIITVTFIIFVVPETKNRTFDDVAASLSFGLRLRKRKRSLQEDDEKEMKLMTSDS